MFNCPYQHCNRTFSHRAALREHVKSYKGQAYWEILNDFNNNLDNSYNNNADEHEDNINMNDIEVFEMETLEHDDDTDDDRFNENTADADTVDAEENLNFEHIPNYTLFTPERTEQITLIDVKTTLDQNSSRFPDAAYAEFMEIVSKHHFSNSAGNDVLKWFQKHHLRENVILPRNTTQGREFVNSIYVDYLLYHKIKVLEYDDEEYYLYHRPIFDAVKELLSNPDILKSCQWDFLPEYIINKDGQRERVYGEQWTGLWWERAHNSIGGGLKKILSIILYSDATTLDHLGKSSKHPVYLSLGNIPIWRRNKCDAKVLLGFLPKLNPLHNNKNNKKSFIPAKRMLYQHCFDIMTQPIYEKLENNGLNIVTDNQIIWSFPFLSEFIGDLPEDASLTLTYNSSRCKRPCHICTITIDELNNTTLSQNEIELRTPENMQFILNQNLSHEYSIHPIQNIFWKFRMLNIYSATVPDRMHHCDLGLFNYQVNFAQDYIRIYCGQEGIDEFNQRLATIPRFSELKSFRHGLGNIARFTASEFRNMMKQLVFVVDGLIIAKYKPSCLNLHQAKQKDKKLVNLFVLWNKMDIFSRKDSFTDFELNKFQEMIMNWAKEFIFLFMPIVNTEMKYPKLHNWYFHIVDAIREYGAINGFTTESYELLHKFCVKIPYRMTNRNNVTPQIINMVRRDSILNYLRKITTSSTRKRQTLTLRNIEGSFTLSNFYEFVNTYKITHHLAPEAEKAFDVLINSLNEYFDLIENVTNEDIEETLIKWYTNATIGQVDIIRAKSEYFGTPVFSDIAINMNEEEAEDYNTFNGMCFAKYKIASL
ncbi:hypothetical protein RhiirA4_427506 [Rhizophagus irregularis]|uniref:C2H2-type domain-containing protein n=1 Tax=Rhizophagus irregularis TaxID=588596 RepID=A0A2I1H981_9GLOM|nr:hypothetical protein RhiirA4_427506 [Rhizophagus irregularis]